ncbi:zonular occludens toxin domain-containing protein [Janthinobacterium sp. CG_S6]|uniref:zonular occludens toxin domain-containing protein n=1 Tax=Janthinobacterium sp. CG_S6 TaxID=3071707 RepID=UPI002DFC1953|nr:zona occludens toxin [Janthinobacterium sp. CG_S6]
MPINAFGGGPGSGKTYGVIEHVILPAIASGRFVITNIEGLNCEAIYQYVVDHFYKGKIICIGHIRQCDRDAPGEDGFFPGVDALDKPCRVPDAECRSVVGGDLVVIDEATRYWPQGDKVSKQAAFFFREHRHFANDLGQTCDMVVIDPDLTLLARPLKGKIELSSLTHKTKSIGLNRYVVRLYRGAKLTGKPQSVKGPYPFSKEIYALYKSYSHESATEQTIDKRQNIFSKGMIAGLLVWVVILGFAGRYTYKYFHPESAQAVLAKSATSGDATGQAAAASRSAVQLRPSFSQEWRYAGSYTAKGQQWVVLVDSSGRLRAESPSVFSGTGALAVGDVDGTRVTSYSGAVSRSSVSTGVSK